MANMNFFDQYGRCVPSPSLKANVYKESRQYFLIEQPEIDYSELYQRFDLAFDIAKDLTLEEFQMRSEKILDSLSDDMSTNGVTVPFILPKADYEDIGQALDNVYLKAVQQSYRTMFPDYSFVNHSPSDLAGMLSVAQGSRHEKLIDSMKKDIVVGHYFPCLLEYSVPAAIEQVAHLPEKFLLAGGFDTAAAFIGCPNLLLRNEGYPPLLWLSGLETEVGSGYHFEAYGYDLTFNRRVHLDKVAEYWASGLVVLG